MSQPLLLRRDGDQIGLIGHLIVDYPDPNTSRELVKIMAEEGVSLVEIQIPFSEPMADGPVFMAANHAALAQGVRVADALQFLQDVRDVPIPKVLMTYLNVPFTYGCQDFCRDFAAAGAAGMIIPDLPMDAVAGLWGGEIPALPVIPVVPPNVHNERLPTLLHGASGFVYAVARAGVTGQKTELGQELAAFVGRIRQHTSLPVAVGFGIRTADDVRFLRPIADYAIVGTHALETLRQGGLTAFRQMWRQLQGQ